MRIARLRIGTLKSSFFTMTDVLRGQALGLVYVHIVPVEQKLAATKRDVGYLHVTPEEFKSHKQAVAANRSFPDLLTLGQFIRRYFASLSPAELLSQAGVRNDFCEAT